MEALLTLDIWRWLGKERGVGRLGKIDASLLGRVNIILTHGARWVLVNLGRLDEWRRGIESDGSVDPLALQKRFLRFMMELFESDTVPVKDKTTEPEDKDDDAAEVVAEIKATSPEKDAALEEDLNALNEVAVNARAELEDNPFEGTEVEETDYGREMKAQAEELASEGVLSAAELKRYERIAESQAQLKNPYTGKGSIKDTTVVTPEDLAIEAPTHLADQPGVIDKSMLKTTLQEFDSRYVKNVLPKDTVNCVMGITGAGVAVTNYEIERVEDVANEYEIHTVKLTPVKGKSSTLRFKLPVISEEGTYTANSVTYRLRKQRVDLPIRKVASNRVALTSYYGKVFIERSTKVVNHYAKWLVKEVKVAGLNNEDTRVTNLKSAKSVRDDLKAPRLYTTLGHDFLSFSGGGVDFYFNYEKREEHFGAEAVKAVEQQGRVLVGYRARTPVVVDEEDTLYAVTSKDLEVLGKIEDVLGFDRTKAPVDIADLKIFSKTVPMGVALAYYVGLRRLIQSLPGTVRRVSTGTRLDLSDDEFAIRFDDETLIVSREDKITALILGGFRSYHKTIRRYSIHEFNKQDIFLNVLGEYGLSVRHLNELDLMEEMFIDPITKEILEEMKEPTAWLPLLRRATELLLQDYAPSETDLSLMRIRGYERIAGAVYTELVNSMRDYRIKSGVGNAAIEQNPFAVWQAINTDNSKVQVEESNPVKNVNESETVTFMGSGGRSRVGMVDRTRVFGQNDMGTISEATVDSGDVAINTYTTANPMFNSLRGLTDRYDPKDMEPAQMLSTGSMLSPSADRDDPKRVLTSPF